MKATATVPVRDDQPTAALKHLEEQRKQPTTTLSGDEYVKRVSRILIEYYSTIRHQFLRVSTQGNNRQQSSIFLAGFTVAGLIGLLALDTTKSAVSFRPQTPSLADVFTELTLLGSAAFLSLSGLLFFLAAVSAYRALQQFANLAPRTIKTLTDTEQLSIGDLIPSDIGLSSEDLRVKITEIYAEDVPRIYTGYVMWERSGWTITVGILLSLVALLLIAFHTHVVVGGLLVIVLLFLVITQGWVRIVLFHSDPLAALRENATEGPLR
jgi:hypothetical protein